MQVLDGLIVISYYFRAPSQVAPTISCIVMLMSSVSSLKYSNMSLLIVRSCQFSRVNNFFKKNFYLYSRNIPKDCFHCFCGFYFFADLCWKQVV